MASDFQPRLGRTGQSATQQAHPQGYRSATKLIHWLIALLVLGQFIVAFLMPEIGRATVPGPLINLHFSLGVVIFILMAIRALLRVLNPVPLDMPDRPVWERWIAIAVHRIFYFILLVGPFLGWASASAHKLSVNVFGLFVLPNIAAPKAGWALAAGDAHSLFMWTLLALIGLHVAGALYHYFFLHDHILQRMLPEQEK